MTYYRLERRALIALGTLCLFFIACNTGSVPDAKTGAATYAVSYDGNGNTSGAAPTDATAYSAGQSAVVLGNTLSLAKTGYTYSGWNTKADGSGSSYAAGASLTIASANVTLYASWRASTITTITVTRIIDHTSYNPGTLSDAHVTKAASLDVYFEHASVGKNIVDGIDALPSATGMARYISGRSAGASDSTWWAGNNGLRDNHRGNPGAAAKISTFSSNMTATTAASIDVAMLKFCYIDVPEGSEYSGKTASDLFTEIKAAMTSLEAKYPNVSFVWWTMPITETSSDEQRQLYNDAVRSYCKANEKWLLDIADLESHDGSGTAITEAGTGRELLYSGYTGDGGHLNDTGAGKLALAYWKLIGEIGKTK